MVEAVAERGSGIWLLTFGSRGDHEPIAALALGLQERGHRVKVFGRGIMAAMFRDRGLDFDALDVPALLDPANEEGRAELGRLAEAEGFEGPGKEEEYVLDSLLLWYEYAHRLMEKRLVEGRQLHEVHPEFVAAVGPLSALLVTGKGVSRLGEFREKHTAFLADRAGRPIGEYAPVARERRAALRASAQRAAERSATDAFTFVRTFLQGFAEYLSECLKAQGEVPQQQRRLLVESQCAAFFAWQKEAVDLDAYWEEWLPRFLMLAGTFPLGGAMSDVSALARQHLPRMLGSAVPDLVICHNLLWSCGLHLQIARGIKWLPMINATPPCTSSGMVGYFAVLSSLEGRWEGLTAPLQDVGPLAYLDMTRRTKYLISCSPLTMSDASASQWHMRACCTGKWVLDEPSSPPPGGESLFGSPEERASLEGFLGAADDPPVCLGWSSMVHTNPGALAACVVGALRLAGRRGVVVAGQSGLTPGLLSEAVRAEYAGEPREAERAKGRILLLQSASHELLFRRCACLVHHGGAGTCHAALRSGAPSVVTPVMIDQPLNAAWIESLGCGVKGPHFLALDAEALAAALGKVLGDARMAARAEEVAAAVAEERGVPAAVEIVEECLREPAPAPPTPFEQPLRPWRDGVFRAYLLGQRLPMAPMLIRGNDLLSADGRARLGQLRSGTFVVEEGEKDGLVPGTYTVEAFVMVTGGMAYGRVSDEGARLSFHDGSSWRLEQQA